METKLRTIHVDKTSRYDMQTEHADKLFTGNHAEEIRVCRLNPPHNYVQPEDADKFCRQKTRKNMQTKYIGKKNAVETCRLNMQKNVTDRTYRKKHVRRICRQIIYAERKGKETCSQDKQTKRADRTSGQIMQTEHAHIAQAFSNFCNIYAEPSQVYLFCNS
jgi:hypothetical protein